MDLTFFPFLGKTFIRTLDGSYDLGRPYDCCPSLCGGGLANADDGAEVDSLLGDIVVFLRAGHQKRMAWHQPEHLLAGLDGRRVSGWLYHLFHLGCAIYQRDQPRDHAKLHPRHCGFAWLSFLETEIQVYPDLWIASLDYWCCLSDLQWISVVADGFGI